ncbi:cation:proton antiporter [Jiella sonneratiae]|uniref:Cation:proton antiporter n=1 Tax=Jiella sonneratiae TaxID=2816856 RepID=A0ABS3IY97_9HYPH|nr:cation:proton antiporter [Jiella sonneratiae]MBO0902364.1 cation:proton antiporter [Jiella sonneratiae]
MPIATVVALVAVVVALGSLARPVARFFRLPVSIVLAAGGLALGLLCLYSIENPGSMLPATFSAMVLDLPVGSHLFLYVFLPTLIFQGALDVDMHRIREDVLPIVILALVAVIVATFGAGLALWPLAGMPLVACLLVASLIATTDPVAVIAIFREVGAPERLTRLVEGESLFNDAAAISLFLIFTTALTAPGSLSALSVAASLILLPLGGAVLGWAVAQAFLVLSRSLADDRIAFVSLSLAVPYLAYWIGEEVLEVSGVIAVVSAGVTLATFAPGRIAGDTWRHLKDTWEQLASWSAILIFVMTSLLVPRLVGGATPHDLLLLLVVFAATLVARALVIFGCFPLLSRFGLYDGVSRSYAVVMIWGGLRGSMTLALALAVTENPAIPRPVAAFVATIATGYTLATLFVQGTTLRLLIQGLRLDVLSGVDRAIRDLALSATSEKVEALARSMAERFRTFSRNERIGDDDLDFVIDPVTSTASLCEEEKLRLALITLSDRQRDIVLSRFAEGKVAPPIARELTAAARQRLDLVRARGAEGYDVATRNEIGFDRLDRMSLQLQRRLGYSRLLARRLGDRFERLAEISLVIDRLVPFADAELRPVLGAEPAVGATAALKQRQDVVEREIAAIRLQYPAYVAKLERMIIARSIRAFKAAEIERLRQSGVINSEVERSVLKGLGPARLVETRRPELDLGLDTLSLIERCDLFAGLDARVKTELARHLRPHFVPPGLTVIRTGEIGDAAYFIASGAMEVERGDVKVRLGSGEIFGELALIFDIRRQADVRAIAYSSLLRLSAQDFARFLERHPDIRAKIEAVARARMDENQMAMPKERVAMSEPVA